MEAKASKRRYRNDPSHARTPTRDLDSMSPEYQCYYLYCRGYTAPQIATMLNSTRQTVMKRVKQVAAELRPSDEDREDWAQESVEAFRQVAAAAWEAWGEQFDPLLLAQITGAHERIAKIRGLIDTGKSKVEVSGPNGGSVQVEFVAQTALARIAAGSAGNSPDA